MLLLWAAAVCVYFFFRNLRKWTGGLSWSEGDWDFFAFMAAAFFALHPINGVLVNYITASVFCAQVIFMIISLMLLQGRQCPSIPASQKNKGWGTGGLENWGALIFFLLALLCHETAVLLPVYAILVLRLKYSWADTFRRVAPLFTVAAAYFVFRSWASPFSRSISYSFSILDLSIDQKAATVIQLLSWYFEKLFLPKDIFLMWSTPFVRDAAWLWWIPFLLFVASSFGILIFKMPRHVLTFFLLWFALGFAPIAAGAFVTPHLGALIEPHWFVFGSIGFFAAVSYGGCVLFKPIGRAVVSVIIVGALMAFSFGNNHLWSDEEKYYEAWSKEAPYFKAVNYFLGLTLNRKNRPQEAYEHLQRAILGRYKDWLVYLELGLIDLRLKRIESASDNLNKAYALEKNHSGLLNAMGALAYRRGKIEEAKVFWERSIKSNPYNLEPRMNMGSYYLKVSEPDKAVEIYQAIIKDNPDFMPAQKALGRLQRRGL
jgi:hypothetical protein